MKYSTLIADMIEEGATPEMILAAVRAVERQDDAAAEASKQKARDRWHRWDEKRRSNVDQRLQTFANDSKQLVRAVEDKPLPIDIEPQERTVRKTGDLAAFRSRLAPLVGADVLEEFIKVRKQRRGALTGYAAGLFIADAEKCGMTPEAAAVECVRSSWITVKPEYFRKATGPPQKDSAAAAVQRIKDQFNAVASSEIRPDQPPTRLVALPGGR